MSSNVLADRDVNAQQPTMKDDFANTKPKSQFPKQVTETRANDEGAFKPQQTISPSDNIQTPTTQKLRMFKSKQAAKMKPQNLFKTTSTRNHEASFANIKADTPSETTE